MSTKKEKFSGSITKTRAVKIFEALGFKTAGGWDAGRLQKKLVNLPNLVEGAELDDKTRKRISVVLKALKQGREVAVVDVDDAAADKKRDKAVESAGKRETTRKAEKRVKDKLKVKSEEKKTVKKVEAKKQVKKAVAASKEKKGLDKFGGREGSIKAAINAVLTKKPKTMEQLLKDAKVVNQQSGHLKSLIEAGYVKKSDKGFALA